MRRRSGRALRVGLERLIQIGELLLERLDGLLGAADVLSLLEDATGAACRGGGAAERRRSHRFSAQERAEEGGADRDRRLEPCWVTCSDSRSTAWPARRILSSSAAIFGAYFLRSRSRASSRCSRPACCRRARKSPSVSPGLEKALRRGQSGARASGCGRARRRSPFARRRSSSPCPRRAAARRRRPPLRGGLEVTRGHRCVHRAVPVGGHGLRGQRRHDRHGLVRVEALLGVGEADLGGAEQHRLVDERRAAGAGVRTGTKCCGTSGGSTGRTTAVWRCGGGRRGGRGLGRTAWRRAARSPCGPPSAS